MTKRGSVLVLALVVAIGLAGCTGSSGRRSVSAVTGQPTGGQPRATPTNQPTGGQPRATPTNQPTGGQPLAAVAPGPARLQATATSTLAEYPADATLDATTCHAPRGPWVGTLRIDQEYLAAVDRVRAVGWTFDSAGQAQLIVGPAHGRIEGQSYTAMFLVTLHLAAGTSSVIVDDVVVRRAGQADLSLRPFMTGLGVATAITSEADVPC